MLVRALVLVLLVGAASSSAEAELPPLRRPDGSAVSLSALASGRPVAIVVIKGPWCRVCRAELQGLSRRIAEVEETGGLVVGLSSDAARENRQLMRKLDLEIDVLGDATHRLLDELGFWIPELEHPAPGLIFLDACGDVVETFRGRRPGGSQDRHVLRTLRRLASESSPCRKLEV